MIGAEPAMAQAQTREAGPTVLEVRQLVLEREDPFGVDLNGVSLQVRSGEVLGIAGVSGNGQGELMRALSGEDTRVTQQMLWFDGQDMGRFSAAKRRRLGLHFVPEERLGRGAVPTMSLAQNLLLTRRESVHRSGWINTQALKEQAMGIIERFGVKAAGPHAAARSLSGGNLQKFIVGREIEAQPKLLIVSQPTWGVDVGASAQIRQAILSLRDAGCAVLVVSEELEELLEMSDRLVVMAKGHVSPSVKREQATVEQIGVWMSGLWPDSPLAHQPDAEDEVTHVAS
jgi:simple sugar transport system ATP-binding protein